MGALGKLPVDAEEWPPALSPPNVSLAVMLDWQEQGCEWPVSGDGIAYDRRKRRERGL